MKINNCIIITITLISFSPYILAQRGQHNLKRLYKTEHWMNHNQNYRKNGIVVLTKEQKDQLKTFRIEQEKQLLPLKNQLREKRAQLQTLRTAEKVDMIAINNLVDEIAELQKKHIKVREAHYQKVRSVLTDEQRIIYDNSMGKRRIRMLLRNGIKMMEMRFGRNGVKGENFERLGER